MQIIIIEIISYQQEFSKSFIQQKSFLLVLDLLIFNWNLLQNKYKKILKNKSKEWIYFLKENKNEYLQQAEQYLYIINKL